MTKLYEVEMNSKGMPNFSTAKEVADRKLGKWGYMEDEYGIDGYRCNQCSFFVPWDYTHKFINYIKDYHYCPNCGAKMYGGEEND